MEGISNSRPTPARGIDKINVTTLEQTAVVVNASLAIEVKQPSITLNSSNETHLKYRSSGEARLIVLFFTSDAAQRMAAGLHPAIPRIALSLIAR